MVDKKDRDGGNYIASPSRSFSRTLYLLLTSFSERSATTYFVICFAFNPAFLKSLLYFFN